MKKLIFYALIMSSVCNSFLNAAIDAKFVPILKASLSTISRSLKEIADIPDTQLQEASPKEIGCKIFNSLILPVKVGVDEEGDPIKKSILTVAIELIPGIDQDTLTVITPTIDGLQALAVKKLGCPKPKV